MAAIRHFIIENNQPPSIAELQASVRKSTPEQVRDDLSVLEQAGYLRAPSDASQPTELIGPWRDPNVSVSGRFAMLQPVVLAQDIQASREVVLRDGSKLAA